MRLCKRSNIEDIFTEIYLTKQKIILVPLNLFNKHAVGLIFEKNIDNNIHVQYFDSLNKKLPEGLEQLIINHFGSNKVDLQQIPVKQQKYANCGPEIIENFVFYLIGTRTTQEKAIEMHSKLVENALLNIDSSNIHLAFEDLAEAFKFVVSYDNPGKAFADSLAFNFDYDNLQYVEVLETLLSFINTY